MNDFPAWLVPISDPMSISRRIKEIDAGYRLFFNNKTNRVEVHNKNNIGDTLSLVCPFDKIDTRLIVLLRQTRRERSKEVFEEIEKNNAKLEDEQTNKTIDNARERVKELLKTKLKKEY